MKTTHGKRNSNLTEQRPAQDIKNPLYHVLAITLSLLARFVASISLILVFYLIVTPIGLLMRLAGRDTMGLRDKAEKNSCRVHSKARDAKHLEKLY